MKKINLLFSAIVVAIALADKSHVGAVGSFQLDQSGEPQFLVHRVIVDDATGETADLDQPVVIELNDTQKHEFKSWAASTLSEVLATQSSANIDAVNTIASEAQNKNAVLTQQPATTLVSTSAVDPHTDGQDGQPTNPLTDQESANIQKAGVNAGSGAAE